MNADVQRRVLLIYWPTAHSPEERIHDGQHGCSETRAGSQTSTSSPSESTLVPCVYDPLKAQDQIAYQTRPDPSNPLFTPMVGCLIAGSRATKKNGATAVIPGSHLWPHDRIPQIEECTYAEMEPGSGLFTLGSTYHGAGENKCEMEDPEALRTLFAVFAQRDYFRQDQEEILSTPIEIARKLPEDILRLTGYCKCSTPASIIVS